MMRPIGFPATAAALAAALMFLQAPAGQAGEPMFKPFDYGPGYGPRDVEELRQMRTRHYTERQWQLSHRVESFCSANLAYCAPARQNLYVVMGQVGAVQGEEAFVWDRMQAVWNARQAMQQSDRLLNDICRDFPQACQGLPR